MSSILITGSGRGIGRATAVELVRRGHRVIATARDPKPVLTYPAPVARADVVLGNADTDQGRRLAERVRQAAPGALAKAGWQGANGQPSGLPSAGFLDALQDAWKAAASR